MSTTRKAAAFTAVNSDVPQAASGGVSTKVSREKTRNERKLALEGGNGVGPARTPRTAVGEKSGPGRNRDGLINNLVIESEEPMPKNPERMRTVVHCVACDRKAIGRDANRIRTHASQCSVSSNRT